MLHHEFRRNIFLCPVKAVLAWEAEVEVLGTTKTVLVLTLSG